MSNDPVGTIKLKEPTVNIRLDYLHQFLEDNRENVIQQKLTGMRPRIESTLDSLLEEDGSLEEVTKQRVTTYKPTPEDYLDPYGY